VEKVSESVYHLPEIVGGPTLLLGETVTIVDTGVPGSEEAILAAVVESGRSPDEVRDIVITHADGDHVGSLRALVERTGATVWAGEHEADVIEGKAPARGGDVKESGSVDRRVVPGETIPVHGGLETIDTRGHTAGHVSLFLPDDRVLIAGDALNNREGLTGSAPPRGRSELARRDYAIRSECRLRNSMRVCDRRRSGSAARHVLLVRRSCRMTRALLSQARPSASGWRDLGAPERGP